MNILSPVTELIPFKIYIEGTFTDTPSPERMYIITSEGKLDDSRVLIAVYESMCAFRKSIEDLPMEDKQRVYLAFTDYMIGVKSRLILKKFKIFIDGKYSDDPNSDRIITLHTQEGLLPEEISCILFDSILNLRNKLAESVDRNELQAFADKFKLLHIGMATGEEPFEIRK